MASKHILNTYHLSPKLKHTKTEILKWIKLFRQRIITICEEKVQKKGTNVGLSFYAFFANKNDTPQLLMEVAKWWIITHKLDHFEKAVKIKALVMQSPE